MHIISVVNIYCSPTASVSEINMVTLGKKSMFLGILMAVLLVVATEGSVMVYNPAKIQVEVLVDDERVKVETDIMSMDITQVEQKINITTAMGGLMSMDVKDGDVIVFLPEPLTGVGNTPVVKVVKVTGKSGDFNQYSEDSAMPPDFDRHGLDYAEP